MNYCDQVGLFLPPSGSLLKIHVWTCVLGSPGVKVPAAWGFQMFGCNWSSKVLLQLHILGLNLRGVELLNLFFLIILLFILEGEEWREERKRKRWGRDRQAHTEICWFTPQKLTITGSGLYQFLELGTPSPNTMWVTEIPSLEALQLLSSVSLSKKVEWGVGGGFSTRAHT